jgi:putative hydrolase of the HAD superfamily
MYEYLCSLLGVPADKRTTVSHAVYEYYFAPGSWKTFDDVMPMLDALKNAGIKMALVSNWDSSLHSIIEGLGMLHYFEVIIASADVKMHKPMPEIFELCLQQTGALPTQTLHVGDHLFADVAGAAKVGITPVLLDRNDRHSDANCLRIGSLSELLKIV